MDRTLRTNGASSNQSLARELRHRELSVRYWTRYEPESRKEWGSKVGTSYTGASKYKAGDSASWLYRALRDFAARAETGEGPEALDYALLILQSERIRLYGRVTVSELEAAMTQEAEADAEEDEAQVAYAMGLISGREYLEIGSRARRALDNLLRLAAAQDSTIPAPLSMRERRRSRQRATV